MDSQTRRQFGAWFAISGVAFAILWAMAGPVQTPSVGIVIAWVVCTATLAGGVGLRRRVLSCVLPGSGATRPV